MGAPDETKRCSRCGETKAVDEFSIKNKKTGLRAAWCRACQRVYSRAHYKRNKQDYIVRNRGRRGIERPRIRAAILAYLTEHPCVDCGEPDILLLDFDHRDRSTKRALVSRLARSSTVRVVMAEIAKCDVRCGNCHRRRTQAQLNWRKNPGFESRRAALPPPRRTPRPSASGKAVIEQLSIWSVGTTRRCGACGVRKPLHDFAFENRKTGRRQWDCRPCHAAARRDHYLRNREHYIAWAMRQSRVKHDEQTALVDEYLRTHPCVDCGESDVRLLEFDHLDGETKLMDLSSMVGRRSTRKLSEEIGKCDVRCVNCHRRRTAATFEWPRFGEDPVLYNVA